MAAGPLPSAGSAGGAAPPISLSAEVYTRLRDAIVRGEYRPNERLVESDLAEQLQTSRTPVRDALQRLAAERLVVTRRRGWVVHEHTPLEIEEIYEVRAALEGTAARLAAERAADEQLADLVALVTVAEEPAQGTARQRLVDVNETFHEQLVGLARNERLRVLVAVNRRYFFNYRIAELYSDAEAEASIVGHRRIVDALLERRAVDALLAAQEHVMEALAVTLTKVR
jgi:DNA-binding GntR family transcriptional regulator